jgi:hypothetical protein
MSLSVPQPDSPALKIELFGPGALATLPELIITPLVIGKFGLVFVNDPIPFIELPVVLDGFTGTIHGEFINEFSINP